MEQLLISTEPALFCMFKASAMLLD